MTFLKKQLKFIFALGILLILFISVISASDSDEIRAKFISMGIDGNIIPQNDEIVTKSAAEIFLEQLSDVASLEEIAPIFSGECVRDGEFLCALLNLLGYSADRGDFLNEFPFDKAAEVGILNSFYSSSIFLTGAELLLYSNGVVSDRASNISSISSFYDPSSSENAVMIFEDGFESFKYSDSNKFAVSVSQGNSFYFTSAKAIQSIDYISEGDMMLGEYFAAVAYSGDDINIDIEMRYDIEKGYGIASSSSLYNAAFVDGKLKLTVSEPQIISITYDDSIGKSLLIYVCDITNSIEDVEKIILSRDNGDLTASKYVECSYIYPGKIIVGNTVCYYPSVISNSKIYISEDFFPIDYNGDNIYVHESGENFIELSEFSNINGYGLCSYNAELGVAFLPVEMSKNDTVRLNNLIPTKNTNVIKEENSVTFSSASSDGLSCVIFKIDNRLLTTAECLRFEALLGQEGSLICVETKFSIIGYAPSGETQIISCAKVNAYSKEKGIVNYFDLTNISSDCESYYFVIEYEALTDAVFTLKDLVFTKYIVQGLGDNEFNPFS